ncbi:MAG: RluA family pseudouridine synthase [Legionellales bacterium]|jgi:23S rRNA pseudouridine955/2504/2580 synthase
MSYHVIIASMDKDKVTVEIREITESEAGQRIDNFLLRILKGVPRSRVYRAIQSGEVRINKKRVDAKDRINTGDMVRIPPIRTAVRAPVKLEPHLTQMLKDRIIYEDDTLLVLDKPSGLAVHGGSGLTLGVIEALRLIYPKAKLELVHRLDRDTSGCLMIAKKRSQLLFLHEALREGHVAKKYITLLIGRWPAEQTYVDLPLHKNILSSGERMVKVDSEGKASKTLFHLIKHVGTMSLMEVTLMTGRTHQIRVHAAYKGHPVAGDEKYGDKTANQVLRTKGLKRLFLHAAELVIPTKDGSSITVKADLDEKLSGFIDYVESRL